MDKILNFRPLAEGLYTKQNKKIKEGMVFRSGAPDRATEDDIKELHEHHINHIYDLRRDIERGKLNPNIYIDVISYEMSHEPSKPSSKPFVETVLEQGADHHMQFIYESYLPFSKLVKSAMHDIIHEKEPFLIHCAAGKDRTGAVAAIMMLVLGFSEEDIINEYVKIDPKVIEYAIGVMRGQGHSEENIQALMPMHTVKRAYMEKFIEGVKTKYSSYNDYLTNEIGLTEESMASFRKHLLT
ncbi:MAG: hypothetical protein A2Y45_08325 [Tenericutes bacterium GWC2_34_14]|nr:MAG: hypothetical protein A2Z84_02875 [Tenericutes bacterium GWA2_35_7]OHE29902.1 MAG: hypothetical protein A2Y45_08325 [Tenericutes bacterium GWC2_34_14]OHE34881.1 MAG: hypothetical protein A2012_01935 [Tenericutes bacterium GWE2_34_108]OHE37259.1 MAG: hypothetical protein A2Y46_01075 [Tenericutes bacterium GWF1_35_14]OHE39609.1 MAG: hypothetical protein A2Y44_01785 [Tenericutes bacterium GWF2_35_184]OHE44203.1 MAG: hypothetical protein A2221_03725 [Tenericutes bacterium RIFOXYA2_FULL_36_3